MTDLKKVAMGALVFPAGWALAAIIYFIIPPMLDVATDIVNLPDVSGTIMFGVFCIWTLGMLVVPAAIILDGIQRPAKTSRMQGIAEAVIFFIFGLLMLIKMWYWFPEMASVFEHVLPQGIFWAGLFTTWVLAFVIAPYYKIISSYEQP